MQYIRSVDEKKGVTEMAGRITNALNTNKKVLWLICGGSNVSYAVECMNHLRTAIVADKLLLLTVAQTDERYGPVGHKDSNWKQLMDLGFRTEGIRTVPILIGKSLRSTVEDYADKMRVIFDEAKSSQTLIVGQFGIGTDGHIAGIVPYSSAVTDSKLVSGYEAGLFIRVTLGFDALRKIDIAYLFAFGESKKDALTALRDNDLSLDEQPAQIMKILPESYIYSDVQ